MRLGSLMEGQGSQHAGVCRLSYVGAAAGRRGSVKASLDRSAHAVSFAMMETVNDRAVVFLPWNTIEPEAQQQILNTASMPFVFKHVAVMPDCHYGKGATVGTVLASQSAVSPAA